MIFNKENAKLQNVAISGYMQKYKMDLERYFIECNFQKVYIFIFSLLHKWV